VQPARPQECFAAAQGSLLPSGMAAALQLPVTRGTRLSNWASLSRASFNRLSPELQGNTIGANFSVLP